MPACWRQLDPGEETFHSSPSIIQGEREGGRPSNALVSSNWQRHERTHTDACENICPLISGFVSLLTPTHCPEGDTCCFLHLFSFASLSVFVCGVSGIERQKENVSVKRRGHVSNVPDSWESLITVTLEREGGNTTHTHTHTHTHSLVGTPSCSLSGPARPFHTHNPPYMIAVCFSRCVCERH